jgi:subtilisin family serine protease
MYPKLLLFIGLIINQLSFAQTENFRFKKLLAEEPNSLMCFAIENDSKSTLDYLLREEIKVKSITKEWIYVTISPAVIAKAKNSGKIKSFYFELSSPVALNDNDTSRMHHSVNQVHAGSNGLPAAYTGQNIIIGYVDQGLDFNHLDFRDANGNTRVLRYWDHSLPVAANTPQPYGYGQVWDSTDIANGICTSGEATSAHGTTVAGAGSGNGLANGKNKGMAPDSKIIIVESNFNLQNWTLTVADACDYIFKVADSLGLPAVVNLSLGTYLGSHDGNDPASILMESLLDEHPGRIIVAAAGNSGNRGKYHVHGLVDSDTSFVWLRNNPVSQIVPNSVYFDLWAEATEFQNVQYAFAADKPAPNYGLRGTSNFHTIAETANSPVLDTIFNAAGQRLGTIQAYSEIVNGVFHMEALIMNIDSTTYNFRFATTGSGSYDMWSGAWLGVNDFVTILPTVAQVPEIIHYNMPDSLQTIVSAWVCSEKVITVGNMRNRFSYTNNNNGPYLPTDLTPPGKLSVNSSKGPSRLGVMKPDITAAGDVTLSPAPLWFLANPANNGTIELGGMHARNGGTSMASPMVAGVVALILDANPYLMPQQVKDIIMQTAREDNYTQVIPTEGSPKWGAGKINAYAAVQLALITVGTNEIKQEKKIEIYPNPTSSELNFKGDFIPTSIELIDLNGRVLKKEIQNGKGTISELKSGTYFVRFFMHRNLFSAYKFERT